MSYEYMLLSRSRTHLNFGADNEFIVAYWRLNDKFEHSESTALLVDSSDYRMEVNITYDQSVWPQTVSVPQTDDRVQDFELCQKRDL